MGHHDNQVNHLQNYHTNHITNDNKPTPQAHHHQLHMQTHIPRTLVFAIVVLGLFVFRASALDLASCASALAPIFSGAQGHQCVQLTITTASSSSSTVHTPALLSRFDHVLL
jgi:hypothetical protein